MKSRKFSPGLACLVVTALLLNFAQPSAAQRRRRTARTTRHASTAPTPAPTPAAATTPATPSPTPTQNQTPQTPTTTRAAQQRQGVPERSIEEMMSADAYGVYAEVRRVGTLAETEELKTAISALKLFGGEDAEPLTDLFGFLDANNEQLAEARAVITFLPTRAGLPQVLVALELPTAESAAAFEPKFRGFVGAQVRTLEGGPKQSTTREGGAQRPSKPNATSGAATDAKPRTDADNEASAVSFKRAGRWLFASDEPFTLKALRGEEGSAPLAENVRFQTARARFASDSVFVYVDTTEATTSYTLQQQKAQEARQAAEANQPAPEATTAQPSSSAPTRAGKPTQTQPSPQTNGTVVVATTSTPQPSPSPASTPETRADTAAQSTPTPQPTEEPAAPQETTGSTDPTLTAKQVEAMPEEGGTKPMVISLSKPSEEQIAAWRMGGVMRALWEGAPRIPGAVAAGVGVEGGALHIRVAVENTPDGVVNIIPFLPNIISGAPVTAEAASVAPDDTDIFLVGSLDWQQIYTNTLGTAALDQSHMVVAYVSGGRLDSDEESGDVSVTTKSDEKPPTPEEAVAAVEKLFGFKFKEDLLPSLGNEVAVSAPLNFFYGTGGIAPPVKDEKEKDAVPGPVAIVSLNDPDKVRTILPRVAAALGLVSAGAVFMPPEKREGFEIRGTRSFAYTIINNSLVIGEDLRAVRHVIDSYVARRTLADSVSYRDSTEWQARQRIAHLFVSDALMRGAIDETKKRSGGSLDPVVRSLLAQLEMRPEPASYQVTNEGDVLVHELHVPLDLLKAYALSTLISAKDATVISAEANAASALSRILIAENEFKDDKKKERYGTLEELVAEKVLEKGFGQHLEYKIELNASGDRFEASATPKLYGKTGRRSFFIDETGRLRSADHAGQPATADDPPVD